MLPRVRRGFTLLEALVALVIVGMASVAVMGAYATELRTASRARFALDATALAEERMAVLELLPVDVLERLPDSLAIGTFEPPFDQLEWRVSASRPSSTSELLDVRVAVSWGDGEVALASELYRIRRREAPP